MLAPLTLVKFVDEFLADGPSDTSRVSIRKRSMKAATKNLKIHTWAGSSNACLMVVVWIVLSRKESEYFSVIKIFYVDDPGRE